jgi:hypothetical protein
VHASQLTWLLLLLLLPLLLCFMGLHHMSI